jgi:hypothetical protein
MAIILVIVHFSVLFSCVIFCKLIVSVAGTKILSLLVPMIGSGSKGPEGLGSLYLMMEKIRFPKLMLEKKRDDK